LGMARSPSISVFPALSSGTTPCSSTIQGRGVYLQPGREGRAGRQGRQQQDEEP
jgi:hypothetical protein